MSKSYIFKQCILIPLFLLSTVVSFSQSVSINTDGSQAHQSAILDLKSVEKGFLMPRMTQLQRFQMNYSTPGLMIYQTDADSGIYLHTGSQWKNISRGLWSQSNSTISNGGSNYFLDDFVFGSPSLNDLGSSSWRSRFFFDKSASAFRAGYTDGPYWNVDSLGSSSFATGINTVASGQSSAAFGEETRATEIRSIAFGWGSEAVGQISFASGRETTASGAQTSTFGWKTTASGPYSSAFGESSMSSGTGSFATGYRSLAAGQQSVSMGYQDTVRISAVCGAAFGINNLVEGYAGLTSGISNTVEGYAGFSSGGYNLSSGDYATSLGLNSQAMGNYSLAIGNEVKTFNEGAFAVGSQSMAGAKNSISIGIRDTVHLSGEGGIALGIDNTVLKKAGISVGRENLSEDIGSIAIGYQSNAKNSNSVAIGNQVLSSGGSSFAAGLQSIASGYTSVSIGNNSIGSGSGSAAFNYKTVAKANNSTTFGFETQANGYNSTVIGMYNDTILAKQIQALSSTPLFVIGNGDADNLRSNAMVVEKNGTVGIGTNLPTALLEVNADVVKKINGGSWTASSDKRLKKDISEYREGVDAILKINPVRFKYNELSGYKTDKEFIGIIAQELEPVAPYMVSEFNSLNGSKYLQVDNSAMVYMLINATKELVKENTELKQKFDILSEHQNSMQKEIEELKRILSN